MVIKYFKNYKEHIYDNFITLWLWLAAAISCNLDWKFNWRCNQDCSHAYLGSTVTGMRKKYFHQQQQHLDPPDLQTNSKKRSLCAHCSGSHASNQGTCVTIDLLLDITLQQHFLKFSRSYGTSATFFWSSVDPETSATFFWSSVDPETSATFFWSSADPRELQQHFSEVQQILGNFINIFWSSANPRELQQHFLKFSRS